jgi:hypothetical protein
LTGNVWVLTRFEQKVTVFDMFWTVLGVKIGKIAKSALLSKTAEIRSSKIEIRNKFEIQKIKSSKQKGGKGDGKNAECGMRNAE